jgi:hypothetical protein
LAQNFEKEGKTKISPNEIEEKISKSNEWNKEKYVAIAHNCHSFVKFCYDVIEPDWTTISKTLVDVPQSRLFHSCKN